MTPNAPMKDPTREIAFDLLSAVLDRRRPLEEALDAAPPADPRDRAAAHRLERQTVIEPAAARQRQTVGRFQCGRSMPCWTLC